MKYSVIPEWKQPTTSRSTSTTMVPTFKSVIYRHEFFFFLHLKNIRWQYICTEDVYMYLDRMWYHWATHLARNFEGRFHWLPYPPSNCHNMESPDLTCTTHLPCQWRLIIPAAPNIVHAIPKCASTVKAMPEAHHGCSKVTGASQSECPQHHSAGMAECGCSQSRSWVSDGVAGLASHSDYTAMKMATTVNFMLHYVTWIIHRHNTAWATKK